MAGQFVWYDLMTPDPKGAVDFYQKVVGWGTADWEGPNLYKMWTVGEQPIGGIMDMPEGVESPPHWLAYVSTSDVAASCARVEELGGSVHHAPQDIPDVGEFAVVADPQGAVFALFSAKEDGPDPGPPDVGRFSWHELATTDHEAAWSFYADVCGWEKTDAMDMGEAGTYQMWSAGDLPLGGMFNKTQEMPGPPFWLYYAMVDDVHATAKVVEELGGKVLNGPMEVPGGDWIVQCMDPQGGMFALHSKAPSSQD